MAGYPGLRSEVLTYPDQRVRAIRAGTMEALTVRIFGRDLDVLREKSAEIQRMLSGIDGVVDPRVDLQSEQPTIEIEAASRWRSARA
jgi:Cu/Ag efflux pump CusA